MNYRGIQEANIVNVLEGKGTPDSPYEQVRYVVAFQNVGSIDRLITLGKIVELTEAERRMFVN